MRKIIALTMENLETRLNLSTLTTLVSAPGLLVGSSAMMSSSTAAANPISVKHASVTSMVAGAHGHAPAQSLEPQALSPKIMNASPVAEAPALYFSSLPLKNSLVNAAALSDFLAPMENIVAPATVAPVTQDTSAPATTPTVTAAPATTTVVTASTTAPLHPAVAPPATVIASLSVTPNATGIQTTGPIDALTWSADPAGVNNLVSMNWVTSTTNPATAAQASLTDPSGMANVFLSDMANGLLTDPLDMVKAADGTATTYSSPWFTNGIADVKAKAEAFFSAYKAAGGHLDYVILDYENGLSNWQLSAAQAQAIQNDPRSAALLQSIGVTSMQDVMNTSTGQYLKWNAAMSDLINSALNTAIFDVAKQYYPNVKGSNYGSAVMTGNNVVPDANNVVQSENTHAGTINSPQLYGVINHLAQSQLVPGTNYGNSPFATLLWEVNTVRGVNLSNSDGTIPWIAYEGYGESSFQNNAYYQELIYQSALSGSSSFLLWDPTAWLPTQNPADFNTTAQAQLVDQTLTQLNAELGPGTRTVVTPNLMNWNSGLVVSGVQVTNGASSKVVWRVSVPTGVTQVEIAQTGQIINVDGAGVWYTSTPGTTVTFEALE